MFESDRRLAAVRLALGLRTHAELDAWRASVIGETFAAAGWTDETLAERRGSVAFHVYASSAPEFNGAVEAVGDELSDLVESIGERSAHVFTVGGNLFIRFLEGQAS